MDTLKKTVLLFLLLCIPIRILFVLISKFTPIEYLHYLGIIALIPSFGFLYFHFNKNQRKFGIFKQKVWWNRIIHGLLYLGFAIFAIMKNKNAYLFLLVDVIYGLGGFVYHHSVNGDFSKLIKSM